MMIGNAINGSAINTKGCKKLMFLLAVSRRLSAVSKEAIGGMVVGY